MIKQQINKKFWMTFLPVFLEALGVVLLILIFLWMKQVAFYSFSNEPYEKDTTDVVQIDVTRDQKVRDVAKELEKRDVIRDSRYLTIRYYCSSYKDDQIIQGVYEVSPSMGVDDILDKITGKQ